MLTDLTIKSLGTNTDKSFWHKYTEAYDPIFGKIRAQNSSPCILEYGVFKGESIQTYLDFFPQVEIHGVDILPQRPEWPIAKNVKYYEVDQSQRHQIKNFLINLDRRFDLVIEDGGHRPDQQFNSLIETLPYMKKGSVYILEDLHTSMKGHPLNKFFRLFGVKYPGNCYQILLAIKHVHELIELGKINANEATNILISKFQKSSLLGKPDIISIYKKIREVQIYKRADLPIECWQCRSHNFDYLKLKCENCGKDLMGIQESLTAILNMN